MTQRTVPCVMVTIINPEEKAMKKKFRRESRIAGYISVGLFLSCMIFLGIFSVYCFCNGGVEFFACGIFICILNIATVFAIRILLLQFLPSLTITDDRIIWKCLPSKKVELKFSDCELVTIVDLRWNYIHEEYFNPDFLSYVCFSDKPLPRDQIKKLAKKSKCSRKGFIAFEFSTKMAESLFEVMPAHLTGEIRSFYFQIKRLEQEQQMKQEKRKKQKERARKNRK